MINLLIVDDEEYILHGYVNGVDWASLGVTGVFGADRVGQARLLVETEQIHIILCDIEMPTQNGLQFAEWVLGEFPNTKIIFLTGHSSFQFAQQAVRLQSFDYLLKPVAIDLLKETVSSAIRLVRAEHGKSELFLKTSTHYKQWEKQKPALIRRFWQDILDERADVSGENINAFFEEYDLPLQHDSPMILILVAAELQDTADTYVKRDLLAISIEAIIGEVLMKDCHGCVLSDRFGNHVAVLYDNPPEKSAELPRLCALLVEEHSRQLHAAICCFIGEETTPELVLASYRSLIDVKNNQIALTNDVIESGKVRKPYQATYFPLNFDAWSDLLEHGKKSELLRRIHVHLDMLKTGNAPRESLQAFCFSLVGILLPSLHKSGLSLRDAMGSDAPLRESLTISTVSQASVWADTLIEMTMNHTRSKYTNTSVIIQNAKEFIQTHIREDVTRDDIANAVFVHPNYLSKLFRNETGQTLTQYITHCRMERAKEFLRSGNDKVSAIGEAVGFPNGGYFAKVFHDLTGMTPQEYRKLHG